MNAHDRNGANPVSFHGSSLEVVPVKAAHPVGNAGGSDEYHAGNSEIFELPHVTAIERKQNNSDENCICVNKWWRTPLRYVALRISEGWRVVLWRGKGNHPCNIRRCSHIVCWGFPSERRWRSNAEKAVSNSVELKNGVASVQNRASLLGPMRATQ